MAAEERLIDQKNPFAKEHGHSSKNKKLTVRQVFIDRMKREGRGDEWYATVKQVMEEENAAIPEGGKKRGFWACSWNAMKRMGYAGAKAEWKLWEEYTGTLHKTSAEIEREKVQGEIREEQRASSLQEAISTLPDRCPISEEIDWIRAHPAMTRKATQADESKAVIITVDDLLCVAHGKCPSKGTYSALQNWANRPEKFFEMLLQEQRKQTDETNERAKGARDVGLEEVERLLQEVKRGSGLGEVVEPPAKATPAGLRGADLAADEERGRGITGGDGPRATYSPGGPVAASSPGADQGIQQERP